MSWAAERTSQPPKIYAAIEKRFTQIGMGVRHRYLSVRNMVADIARGGKTI